MGRNIFNNYEFSGFGDEQPNQALLCPDGQIGSPGLGIPCVAIPGTTQAQPPQAQNTCPDGQVGFPQVGIPCVAIPGMPQSTPAQAANPCPPGSLGWPAQGIPCQLIPQGGVPGWPPAGGGIPGTLPGSGVPQVTITPGVPPQGSPGSPGYAQQASAPASGSGLPSWVVPVAIGGVATVVLLAMFSKKRRA